MFRLIAITKNGREEVRRGSWDAIGWLAGYPGCEFEILKGGRWEPILIEEV